jgi:hypothetical protein
MREALKFVVRSFEQFLQRLGFARREPRDGFSNFSAQSPPLDPYLLRIILNHFASEAHTQGQNALRRCTSVYQA